MFHDNTANMILGMGLAVTVVVIALLAQFTKRSRLDNFWLIAVVACFLLLVVHLLKMFAQLPGAGF